MKGLSCELGRISSQNMSSLVKNINKCRICGNRKLFKFLDLGLMPIPNGFLSKDQLRIPEQKFELACFFCEDCGLVQLTRVVNPNVMFKNYAYVSAMANVMMNNFSNLSYELYKMRKLNSRSFVIDIGSNDGSLLTFFKNYGVRVLGIDPAQNIAKVAQLRGIPTECLLFNFNNAKKIRKKYGAADVICAVNVIAHIDSLQKVMAGVDNLLAKDGLFATEFPYLLDLIKKNEFDTIYHEHLSYFSLRPWIKLVESYDLEVVNAQRLLIHGGSIRLIHRRKNAKKRSSSKVLDYLISLEENTGLYSKEKLSGFSNEVEKIKLKLRKLLLDLKKDKKRIIGYGAAAKGNVLMNYFGIDSKFLDYIVDSTPFKQGLFTPGNHIPIIGEMQFRNDKNVDFALILAWNFADEIIAKEKNFKKRGGKFIVPIPKLKII